MLTEELNTFRREAAQNAVHVLPDEPTPIEKQALRQTGYDLGITKASPVEPDPDETQATAIVKPSGPENTRPEEVQEESRYPDHPVFGGAPREMPVIRNTPFGEEETSR